MWQTVPFINQYGKVSSHSITTRKLHEILINLGLGFTSEYLDCVSLHTLGGGSLGFLNELRFLRRAINDSTELVVYVSERLKDDTPHDCVTFDYVKFWIYRVNRGIVQTEAAVEGRYVVQSGENQITARERYFKLIRDKLDALKPQTLSP